MLNATFSIDLVSKIWVGWREALERLTGDTISFGGGPGYKITLKEQQLVLTGVGAIRATTPSISASTHLHRRRELHLNKKSSARPAVSC